MDVQDPVTGRTDGRGAERTGHFVRPLGVSAPGAGPPGSVAAVRLDRGATPTRGRRCLSPGYLPTLACRAPGPHAEAASRWSCPADGTSRPARCGTARFTAGRGWPTGPVHGRIGADMPCRDGGSVHRRRLDRPMGISSRDPMGARRSDAWHVLRRRHFSVDAGIATRTPSCPGAQRARQGTEAGKPVRRLRTRCRDAAPEPRCRRDPSPAPRVASFAPRHSYRRASIGSSLAALRAG